MEQHDKDTMLPPLPSTRMIGCFLLKSEPDGTATISSSDDMPRQKLTDTQLAYVRDWCSMMLRYRSDKTQDKEEPPVLDLSFPTIQEQDKPIPVLNLNKPKPADAAPTSQDTTPTTSDDVMKLLADQIRIQNILTMMTIGHPSFDYAQLIKSLDNEQTRRTLGLKSDKNDEK